MLYVRGMFMVHPVCLSDSTIGARAAESAGKRALAAETEMATSTVRRALSGVIENDRKDCTNAEP